jgi:hypothetical protein
VVTASKHTSGSFWKTFTNGNTNSGRNFTSENIEDQWAKQDNNLKQKVILFNNNQYLYNKYIEITTLWQVLNSLCAWNINAHYKSTVTTVRIKCETVSICGQKFIDFIINKTGNQQWLVYGLDGQVTGVHLLLGKKILSPPQHPDCLWGWAGILFNGYRGLFP